MSQPASRRVKTIYSVIASSNRLEILRILNTKGPLTYSELKTLAGFKSKKESGKFAYHLRKLVRQMLIQLNRSERKYTVTNLGRLVLNLTRQIEEQSVIESGKLYVRTSRQTMEEFNADRILQSLVREAGMPVELAQKITSETEARIYKFQANYLTAPLIREIVNALLIEHGYEEYRHKLTRLGLPVFDVSDLIDRVGSSPDNVDSLIRQTGHRVLAEYLLLAQLPRDVADAHLAGEIHISSAGGWGLTPDTLFLELPALLSSPFNLGGKLVSLPRFSKPEVLTDAATTLALLGTLCCREVTREACFGGLVPFLANVVGSAKDVDILRALRQLFSVLSATGAVVDGHPFVTYRIDGAETVRANLDDALLDRVRSLVLQAYREYVEQTPFPQVKLVVMAGKGVPADVFDAVGAIAANGGCVALCSDVGGDYAFSGVRRDVVASDVHAETVAVLHSLAINLPRLAYESNQDETYFRAKLALLLQTSLAAQASRRRIIGDLVKKGLLPTLSQSPTPLPPDHIPAIINLVGLTEAVTSLLGDKAASSARRSLAEKTVETAIKVAAEKGEHAGIAMLPDEGALRFATLDTQRYGKSAVAPAADAAYTTSPLLTEADLGREDLQAEFAWYVQKLTGGYAPTVTLPKNVEASEAAKLAQQTAQRLTFVKLDRNVTVCRSCGTRNLTGSSRCRACKSISSIQFSTALA